MFRWLWRHIRTNNISVFYVLKKANKTSGYRDDTVLLYWYRYSISSCYGANKNESNNRFFIGNLKLLALTLYIRTQDNPCLRIIYICNKCVCDVINLSLKTKYVNLEMRISEKIIFPNFFLFFKLRCYDRLVKNKLRFFFLSQSQFHFKSECAIITT